jgi:hypothetical protein
MPETFYDSDFFAWLQQQAAAIRAGDWDAHRLWLCDGESVVGPGARPDGVVADRTG